ncbi:MAG TPA: hypothetical protein VFI95_02640 [Terriglobales bacterium]|nr:hypothetical protein [Terriglobales bacterium]
MKLRSLTLVALTLTLGIAASAQLQVGDDLLMNLNGNLSAGYNAGYSNFGPSNHGFVLGGNANLRGSYYNPKFLSFTVSPFYNQSRANSSYQSISDATGLTSSAAIFSGSNFPGSISYSRTYNSTGNFGLPGQLDLTSHGNGDSLSLGWAENLPDAPHVNASFQEGHSTYSLYGAQGEGQTTFKSFNLGANYMIEGFNLTANYRHSNTHADLPPLFGGEGARSSSHGDSYGFGVGHALPLHGSFSAAASKSYTQAEYANSNYNGTVRTANAGVGFNPLEQLNVGVNTQYTDNVTGLLYQNLINSGTIVVPLASSQSIHGLDTNAYGTYNIPVLHLTLGANAEHRDQSFGGKLFTADAQTGTVTYSNAVLGGFFNSTVGVVHSSTNSNGQSATGLITSLNYTRRIGAWNVTGFFNFSQNTQTLLILYTTESYGYSGSVSRKFNRFRFSLGAGGSKTWLTQNRGSESSGQNYTATFGLRWASVNGSYSKSDGNAILTGAGLTPTPVPSPILIPSAVVLYGGHAWSVGVGSSPMRGLLLSAGFSKARSDTFSILTASNNSNDQFNTTIDYAFRKMYFRGGYSRTLQGISGSGLPPAMVGTFYVGIYRWFDFF